MRILYKSCSTFVKESAMSALHRSKRNPLFKPKPIAALTLLSLSALAQAAIQPNGPFADTPLHLQATSESTTGTGVKPNVMLQIDDSGSMSWLVNIRQAQSSTNPQRMSITRPALLNLVQHPEYKNAVNWNMISLCNTDGSQTNSRVYSNSPSWRFGLDVDTELVPMINKLNPSCGTPSTSRYLDSIYILQKALDQPTAYRCQKSYVMIFSDGEPNDANREPEGNTNQGFVVRPTSSYWFAGTNPIRYHLPPLANQNAATLDNMLDKNNPRSWLTAPSGGIDWYWTNKPHAVRFFADSVYYNDIKRGGVDAAGKSWDDPDPAAPEHNHRQSITTFAVGLGLNSPYLDNSSTGNNYKAFSAYNEAQLNAAFKAIFDQINSENKSEPPSSFSSISPTLSGDDTDAKLPALAAAVRLDVKSGSSEVRFYDVVTQNGRTIVKDTYRTPGFGNRRIIINNGSTNQWLDWATNLSNLTFGIPITGSNTNEWKTAMIPWISRSIPDNAPALSAPSNALKYRNRSTSNPNARDMGDVIAAPIHSYGPQKHGRQQFFVTAANDGLVYLFESSSNSNHPYELRVNYMPAGMERESTADTLGKHYADIAHPDYVVDSKNYPHRYMINGGMVIRTTEKTDRFAAGQRHFLAGNMGQGGRGAYSLNLGGWDTRGNKVGLDDDSNNWLNSIPLFETQKGANNTMGYTIGSPQIGRMAPARVYDPRTFKMTPNFIDVRYGTFVSSGTRYPSMVQHQAGGVVIDKTEAALYVYNSLTNENVGLATGGASLSPVTAKAGDLVAKIPVPDANNNRGGLMQPTLVDMDFDGVVDIAYAADYRGGLYRFDFRNGYSTTQTTVHKIFQAQDKQVVTSAPAVYRNEENKYIVIFGTGSDLYQADQSNKDVQSVYGIYDDLTVTSPTSKTAANLLQQNLTATGSASGGAQTRTLSDIKFDDTKHQGWYFNLPAGERVVVKPDLLLKTVIFTTRSYSVSTSSSGTGAAQADPCVASSHTQTSKGESWLMQVKADTGGNLSSKDSMEYAYIDFLNTNTNKDKRYRPSDMFAGYKSANGGILTYVLTVGGTDANKIGNIGNATTLNGDTGGTGTDFALTPGGQNIRQCLSGSNHSIFLSDSSATQGVNDPLSIYGKACAASLARISWREIF